MDNQIVLKEYLEALGFYNVNSNADFLLLSYKKKPIFLRISETADNSFRVMLPSGWSVKGDRLSIKALIAANEVNNTSRIAIVQIQENQIWATATILTPVPPSKGILIDLLDDLILALNQYFIFMEGESHHPVSDLPQFSVD